MDNVDVFLEIFKDLNDAPIYSPRGMKVKEIINYCFELEDPYNRFMNFFGRGLDIRYIVGELAWYLRGNLCLDGIDEYSKFWLKIVDKDGNLNSNYGKYIFKELQLFNNVIHRLSVDKDTRQAIILINRPEVALNNNTKDQICTTSLQFFIRDNRLHMITTMRSQDVILGLGNDLPFFTILQELVYNILKHKYKDLSMGKYYHNVGSLHVYERHFEMIDNIIKKPEFKIINMPKIKSDIEAIYIINNFGNIERQFVNDEFNYYNMPYKIDFIDFCLGVLNNKK